MFTFYVNKDEAELIRLLRNLNNKQRQVILRAVHFFADRNVIEGGNVVVLHPAPATKRNVSRG